MYDSVSYGMVDNLGRSDEWLGIIWLGSGEARWASGKPAQHEYCAAASAKFSYSSKYYRPLGTLRSPSLSPFSKTNCDKILQYH